MRATRSRTERVSIQLVPRLRRSWRSSGRSSMMLQRGLAPCDDGVDTGTVSVMRTDTAVAVAVEPGGIAAGTAITLAGDQVDERRIADSASVDRGARLSGQPSLPRCPGVWARSPRAMPTPEGMPPADLSECTDGPARAQGVEVLASATEVGATRHHGGPDGSATSEPFGDDGSQAPWHFLNFLPLPQ